MHTISRKTSIPTPNLVDKFSMMDRIPAHQCTTTRDDTLGQWTESPLSHAYFSDANVQIVQNGIRAGVFHKSNGHYTIAPQDSEPLKVVMRSIFLQHAVNQPQEITSQIAALNKKVWEYSVEQIYGEAKGRMKYLYDINKRAAPMSLPVMATQKGTRQYKMTGWFSDVHDNEQLRLGRNKPQF